MLAIDRAVHCLIAKACAAARRPSDGADRDPQETLRRALTAPVPPDVAPNCAVALGTDAPARAAVDLAWRVEAATAAATKLAGEGSSCDADFPSWHELSVAASG